MNRSENRLLPVIASEAPEAGGASDETARRTGHSGRAGKAAPAALPYAAQILGQGGQKRGLKGGRPVLKAANAAYLGTEYSGEQDRRPPPGLLKRTTI